MTEPKPRSGARHPTLALWDQMGMMGIFVIIFLVSSLLVDNFLTWGNLQGLALSVSITGMVACTMLFCLASGNFDLSVGSVVACSGVLAAVLINATGSVMLGVIGGVLGGGLVGAVNGTVIAKFKINALITTLATMQIVRGIGYIISGGKAVGIKNSAFFLLGNSAFLGIPTPVWITIACFALFAFLLNWTSFGRNTLAIGGNEEATFLAGVSVDLHKIVIFTAQGLMSGFAGVVLASRMTSGQPMTSLGFELEVISACVLGGVSLQGGVGAISSIIAGVLILGTVQDVMNLMTVPTFYQYVARGVILLIAVFLDRLKQKS